MKLVKIVKLQRVRYGDLDEGAEYKSIHAMSSESANKRTGSEWDAVWANEWVTPMDTDKYPPEVTYNIEGIPEGHIIFGSGEMRGFDFRESDVEARYV